MDESNYQELIKELDTNKIDYDNMNPIILQKFNILKKFYPIFKYHNVFENKIIGLNSYQTNFILNILNNSLDKNTLKKNNEKKIKLEDDYKLVKLLKDDILTLQEFIDNDNTIQKPNNTPQLLSLNGSNLESLDKFIGKSDLDSKGNLMIYNEKKYYYIPIEYSNLIFGFSINKPFLVDIGSEKSNDNYFFFDLYIKNKINGMWWPINTYPSSRYFNYYYLNDEEIIRPSNFNKYIEYHNIIKYILVNNNNCKDLFNFANKYSEYWIKDLKFNKDVNIFINNFIKSLEYSNSLEFFKYLEEEEDIFKQYSKSKSDIQLYSIAIRDIIDLVIRIIRPSDVKKDSIYDLEKLFNHIYYNENQTVITNNQDENILSKYNLNKLKTYYYKYLYRIVNYNPFISDNFGEYINSFKDKFKLSLSNYEWSIHDADIYFKDLKKLTANIKQLPDKLSKDEEEKIIGTIQNFLTKDVDSVLTDLKKIDDEDLNITNLISGMLETYFYIINNQYRILKNDYNSNEENLNNLLDKIRLKLINTTFLSDNKLFLKEWIIDNTIKVYEEKKSKNGGSIFTNQLVTYLKNYLQNADKSELKDTDSKKDGKIYNRIINDNINKFKELIKKLFSYKLTQDKSTSNLSEQQISGLISLLLSQKDEVKPEKKGGSNKDFKQKSKKVNNHLSKKNNLYYKTLIKNKNRTLKKKKYIQDGGLDVMGILKSSRKKVDDGLKEILKKTAKIRDNQTFKDIKEGVQNKYEKAKGVLDTASSKIKDVGESISESSLYKYAAKKLADDIDSINTQDVSYLNIHIKNLLIIFTYNNIKLIFPNYLNLTKKDLITGKLSEESILNINIDSNIKEQEFLYLIFKLILYVNISFEFEYKEMKDSLYYLLFIENIFSLLKNSSITRYLNRESPSSEPSDAPSTAPSAAPSAEPSAAPSPAPSEAPSGAQSGAPSSAAPSVAP